MDFVQSKFETYTPDRSGIVRNFIFEPNSFERVFKTKFYRMEDWIQINDLITLSPLTLEDKPNMIRYLNDAAVGANTLTIPQPYTEADADERLEKVKQKEKSQK